MNELTDHQRQALEAYRALMVSHPKLFAGRASRPIVRDFEVLAAYASAHNVVLGVAADNPYVLFIVDLVEDGRAVRYPYMRVVYKAQLKGAVNVVVIATIEDQSLGRLGDIVFVDHERHAPGTRELELPRGMGEEGLTGEQNALRELQEESGYSGKKPRFLGSTLVDSGLTDCLVSFYHVPVTQLVTSSPEATELIHSVHLLSRDQAWERIRSGELRDAFTIQALALFEKLGDR